MVLFYEKKTCRVQSAAVEIVGIFEDLAYCLDCDVLREDVLAFLLDAGNVVSVGELYGQNGLRIYGVELTCKRSYINLLSILI